MTRTSSYEGISSPNRAWVDSLRAHCLMMVQRPEVFTAMSFSRAFPHGTEEERERVIVVGQRLAEEYGLLSEVYSHGYFVSIRFSRSDSGREPHADRTGNSGGLLAKLRSLFGQNGSQQSAAEAEQARGRVAAEVEPDGPNPVPVDTDMVVS